MPRVALHTLGCRLNHAETSAIARQFHERGYEIVPFGETADVCVINTCTVTERADRECRQIIRRALRTSPDPVVVVTGCYAQLEPEQVASIAGVDLVLGSTEKFRLFEHMPVPEKLPTPRVIVRETGGAADFGPAASSGAGTDRTRAFLKVQDGCDYTCSFCTIPRARGGSRSQTLDAAVTQARELVAAGFRDVTLTGVNLGEYAGGGEGGLLPLLRALEPIEGLLRLRISSIEPNLLSDAILEQVASSPVICPHFHIPLQSGSPSVLRRMRRRYTVAQYAGLLERILRRIPDCGIGADVIVGFPGETEAEFRETRTFLADAPVSYLHVFTYSERERTPAAGYGDSVPRAVRQERNAVLRDLSARKRNAFHAAHEGREAEVLLESTAEAGLRFGLTPNSIRVGVRENAGPENTLLRVRIGPSAGDWCHGRPLTAAAEAA